MEKYWADKPFAKTALLVAAGMILANQLVFSDRQWLILFVIILPLPIGYEYLPLHQKWNYTRWIGICMHLLLLAWGGWIYSHFSNENNKPSLDTESIFLYKIEKNLDPTRSVNRYLVSVYQVDSSYVNNKGQGILSVFNSKQQVFARNDIILSDVYPKEIKSKINPGEMDFKKIQNQKAVYWNLYWDEENMAVIQKGKPDWISVLHQAPLEITNTLRKYIKYTNHAQLASALLIGYKEDVDPELIESYMNTGVIHVIAVSGMHVGLIFMLITGIANQILTKKQVRQFGIGIVLPLIWIFSEITGSSASIVRSAWMFSAFLLAQVIFRKNKNLNSLGCSGFIMLSMKPDWLFSIGFQLSFAAVGSLILYHQVFDKLFKIENKIVKWIWHIVATTLAAQILTLPFIIFHFKTFPLLFLISNLIVVPLSSLILILLIILLIFSSLPVIATGIGHGIDLLMLFMNSYVVAMDQIPFTQLHLYTWQLSSCFTLALLLISIFKRTLKLKATLNLALFWCILLVWDLYWQEYKLHQTNRLYVLQKNKMSMIIHQHGALGEIIIDSSVLIKNLVPKKQIQNLSKELGVSHWNIRLLSNSTQLLNIESIQKNCSLEKPFEIIRKGSDFQFHEYQNQLGHRFLVADGSNKVWKIKEWQSQAQQLNLPLYSTQEKGFFSLNCYPFPRR